VSLLLRAISPTPDRPGLLGLALVRVDMDGLTAWASALPAEPAAFTRDDVLDDHRVVTQICEHVSACLPARFPTLVSDEATLRTQLAARAEELRRHLELVSGACELAVTAVWTTREEPSTNVDADTPGRRYMLRRQAALAGSERRHARASEVADTLERQAGAALRRAERRVCPSAEVAVSLALLVERAAADDVRARLSLGSTQDVRILVDGPWPPYTFAT
jgi:hypothetical protein